MIVNGQLHGSFRRWHPNGELAGLSKAYFPSGFMKSWTMLQSGKVVEQKFWNELESRESRWRSLRRPSRPQYLPERLRRPDPRNAGRTTSASVLAPPCAKLRRTT